MRTAQEMNVIARQHHNHEFEKLLNNIESIIKIAAFGGMYSVIVYTIPEKHRHALKQKLHANGYLTSPIKENPKWLEITWHLLR